MSNECLNFNDTQEIYDTLVEEWVRHVKTVSDS